MFGLNRLRLNSQGGSLGFAIQRALFNNSEQGLWYDLNDDSTIYQDSAGTTLASWGDPVGLVLDKSKGLAPTTVYTSDFSAGADGWVGTQCTADGNIDGIGGQDNWLRATMSTGVGANHRAQKTALTALARHRITVTYYIPSGQSNVDGIRFLDDLGTILSNIFTVTDVATTVTFECNPVSTGLRATAYDGASITFTDAGGDDVFYIKDVVVQTLAGNHAIQSTSGARMIRGRMPKRGRVNLLVSTGNLNGTGWTRAAVTVLPSTIVAPDGTTTADRIYPNSSGAAATRFIFGRGVAASSISTGHLFLAPAGKTAVVFYGANGTTVAGYVNLTTGVASSVAVGYTITTTAAANGFYYIVVTSPAAADPYLLFAAVDAVGSLTITASGTDGIAAWRPQLELGSTATAYQHVIDSLGYNVTESGQPSCGYLSFNGSNQWMQTAAAVDFSATDEMSVFVGVRKVSDAAVGLVLEHSATINANNGAFIIAAPTAAAANYLYGSKGTTRKDASYTNAAVAAPVSNVITGMSDISADSCLLRVNGAQVASDLTDQGTGNYGNYVTYFGARAGTSLYFNGLMFSIIIRGALTSGTLLTRTEQYVADRTPTVYSFPTSLVAPVISGTPEEEQVLTSTTGTWSGIGTLSYSYQWKRGTTNVGTDANTYTLTAADIGFNITCVVTATTIYGSGFATSNSLGPVTAIVYEFLGYAVGDGSVYANGDGSTSNNTAFGVIGTSPKNDWSMVSARQFGGHGIDEDNTLYSWGNSAASGDSTVNQNPVQVGVAGEWSYIYSGLIIALGIKTTGTLWGWGSGLGAGTGASANATPTQVGSDTDWAMAVNGEQHSGGIKTGGTLWMWGLNTTYQLGDNTTTQRNTPVQIGSDTDWAQLSCGNDVHTAAVKTDGTLWGWGSTANGRLGVVAGSPQQVPTQIGTDTDWQKVQCGSSSTVALKTDGTIWAIGGLNGQGELGDGTTTASSTPTQIGSATNWVDIILSNTTTYAVNDAGELWVCGSNAYYFFGDGTTTNSSTLVEVSGVTGLHKVATSSRNTFVVTRTPV